jgi:hypothetical protein
MLLKVSDSGLFDIISKEYSVTPLVIFWLHSLCQSAWMKLLQHNQHPCPQWRHDHVTSFIYGGCYVTN